MITINESVGTAEVCVICSELPQREILVNLNEQPGTAQGTILSYTHHHFFTIKQIHMQLCL